VDVGDPLVPDAAARVHPSLRCDKGPISSLSWPFVSSPLLSSSLSLLSLFLLRPTAEREQRAVDEEEVEVVVEEILEVVGVVVLGEGEEEREDLEEDREVDVVDLVVLLVVLLRLVVPGAVAVYFRMKMSSLKPWTLSAPWDCKWSTPRASRCARSSRPPGFPRRRLL
jgi:hypothetical protein